MNSFILSLFLNGKHIIFHNLVVVEFVHLDLYVLVECNVTNEYLNISNGNVTYNRYYYTQNLIYTCDEGYRGINRVTCQSDGTWSILPACIQIPTTTHNGLYKS